MKRLKIKAIRLFLLLVLFSINSYGFNELGSSNSSLSVPQGQSNEKKVCEASLLSVPKGAYSCAKGVLTGPFSLIAHTFKSANDCFDDPEQKKGIIAPVRKVISKAIYESWMKNFSCAHLQSAVANKIRSTRRKIRNKKIEAQKFQSRFGKRKGVSQKLLARFPEKDRTLTDEELEFDKLDRLRNTFARNIQAAKKIPNQISKLPSKARAATIKAYESFKKCPQLEKIIAVSCEVTVGAFAGGALINGLKAGAKNTKTLAGPVVANKSQELSRDIINPDKKAVAIRREKVKVAEAKKAEEALAAETKRFLDRSKAEYDEAKASLNKIRESTLPKSRQAAANSRKRSDAVSPGNSSEISVRSTESAKFVTSQGSTVFLDKEILRLHTELNKYRSITNPGKYIQSDYYLMEKRLKVLREYQRTLNVTKRYEDSRDAYLRQQSKIRELEQRLQN